MCDVASAGDGDPLALDRVVPHGEHLFEVVHDAVAGRFGSDETAAKRQALASQDAGTPLVAQLDIGAVQEADFATAHSDLRRVSERL